MSPPRLSRRTVLRGGAVCVGLPLLDAMLPRAFAQSAVPSRFVAVYMGTCTGGASLTNPSALGPFNAPLPLSFAALQAVAQHVSIISGLNYPIYASGGTPTAPGSAVQVQHGGTISPALSGVSAQDSVLPLIRGTTADQLAADFLGTGSKFRSLQLRVQAASYNNRTGTSAQQRGMSLRKTGATLSELLPNESPARLYNMLFSGAPPSPSPTPGLPAMLSKRKSVLDLVLDDANRLTNSVGGDDRARLDQHFTAIRELEKGLTPPVSGTDAGVTMPPPPPLDGGVVPPNPGTCGAAPMNPGVDPAISTYDFGGWANETQRGNSMADMIAYALACDLTRVASWMLTHDQCWLNSQHLSNSTVVTTSGGHQGPQRELGCRPVRSIGGQPRVARRGRRYRARPHLSLAGVRRRPQRARQDEPHLCGCRHAFEDSQRAPHRVGRRTPGHRADLGSAGDRHEREHAG